MRNVVIFFLIILFVGCGKRTEQIGVFSVAYKDKYIEITDGIGRKLILVKRGDPVPKGYKRYQIVRIPVRKVIAYSLYTVSLIKELGHIDTVRGVVFEKSAWKIPEIREGIERGKVIFIGESPNVDFEKIKKINPDVVFSWSPSIIPKLEELGIPCVITSSRIAPSLRDHIKFILYLSFFYNEEDRAKRFIREEFKKIEKIASKAKSAKHKPRVIWGDIYPKKVLVEPGNSWSAQAVKIAGGKYLFDDIQGTSCMQITIEKFFSRARCADILITYRGPEMGIRSKRMLRKINPLLRKIKIRPLYEGEVYSTRWTLWQTADTADVIYELGSIFHPKLFPRKKLIYFYRFPEENNVKNKAN